MNITIPTISFKHIIRIIRILRFTKDTHTKTPWPPEFIAWSERLERDGVSERATIKHHKLEEDELITDSPKSIETQNAKAVDAQDFPIDDQFLFELIKILLNSPHPSLLPRDDNTAVWEELYKTLFGKLDPKQHVYLRDLLTRCPEISLHEFYKIVANILAFTFVSELALLFWSNNVLNLYWRVLSEITVDNDFYKAFIEFHENKWLNIEDPDQVIAILSNIEEFASAFDTLKKEDFNKELVRNPRLASVITFVTRELNSPTILELVFANHLNLTRSALERTIVTIKSFDNTNYLDILRELLEYQNAVLVAFNAFDELYNSRAKEFYSFLKSLNNKQKAGKISQIFTILAKYGLLEEFYYSIIEYKGDIERLTIAFSLIDAVGTSESEIYRSLVKSPNPTLLAERLSQNLKEKGSLRPGIIGANLKSTDFNRVVL